MMKMNNTYVCSAISFLIVLGFSGCAHYKARPLGKLSSGVSLEKNEQSMSFIYRVYGKDDCKRFLDRNVLEKGYQPVHITFINNSNRFLYISPSNFSFPCVASDVVAQEVHTSTTKRAVGYGVAGLFLWPLLIPAIVDGVGSSEANKQLDADFAQKSLRSHVVGPFNMVNGLIFVPLEYFDEDFTVTIFDRDTHEQFVLSSANTILKI